MIQIRINGVPAPGGSKTAMPLYRGRQLVMKNGRPIIRMVDAGKGNKRWRRTCAKAARATYRGEPLNVPLFVVFEFTMPRPKYHYRTGKFAGILRSDAPAEHTSAPDTTKLIRSTEDSLKNIVWTDDSIISRQTASKVYGDEPGCTLKIYAIEPAAADLFQPTAEAM